MNQEYERLQKLIREAEDKAKLAEDSAEATKTKGISFRNGYHIMPPTGWLNDPNGLCQFGDEYHLFFQYSPLDARGGMKAWGHYVTKDFVNLSYVGAPFVPDEDFDKNGVYSGSCYIDEAGMHIFYTGNVKLPGDYDYINAGRRADTILVESRDGRSFGEKQVVIDTDEYPKGYSCHIRDPKVWRENGIYYMVLGARTEDSNGRILIYSSSDMHKWSLGKILSSDEPFGYMWECPDIFRLDGEYVVSFSPQGLEAEEYRYQNTYQAGYVIRDVNPAEMIQGVGKAQAADILQEANESQSVDRAQDVCESQAADKSQNIVSLHDEEKLQTSEMVQHESSEGQAVQLEESVVEKESFIEWDMGFDFYAPQTFLDSKGRRILVGWAGMPDPGYENGEVEAENWQHCFTVPRCLEIREGVDGRKRVFQTPIEEIVKLRNGEINTIDLSDSGSGKSHVYTTENECLDVICNNISGDFSFAIALDVTDRSSAEITGDGNEEDGSKMKYLDGAIGVIFSYDGEALKLTLSDECGLGRKVRRAKLASVHSLRILVDNSIVEFYVNDGEMVFTTRYYKKMSGSSLHFDMPGAEICLYEMERMKVDRI